MKAETMARPLKSPINLSKSPAHFAPTGSGQSSRSPLELDSERDLREVSDSTIRINLSARAQKIPCARKSLKTEYA